MERLTDKLLKDYVLTILGNSSTSVELKDSDWIQIMERTKLKYNKYRPKMIEYPLTITVGKQDYQLEPNKIGRGVFDVIFDRVLGDQYLGLFDSSYFPLNMGGYRNDVAQFVEWRILNQASREAYGTTDDWDFNPDTNTLRIFPAPIKVKTVSYLSAHNRIFGEFIIGEGDGAATQFTTAIKDTDGFKIPNLIPGIRIRTKNEIFRDLRNGTLESSLGGTGTVNYQTGDVELNFNAAPASEDPIIAEVYEVRTNDIDWYQDYALALAKIIVGYKRRRFGSIPGQQASITLDTAIKDDGGTEIEKLEDTAKLWMAQYLIPRQQ